MTRLNTNKWLAIILIISVGLRVVAALYLGDAVEILPGTQDQVSYNTLAQRVLDGSGFSFDQFWWPATPAGEPTAHWSYLYTLYLAGVYGLFGYHPLIARLIQATLTGLLMPWLVYRLGSIHFDRRVGLVAAGGVAIYSYFIYYSGTLMTESFYITSILWVLERGSKLGQEKPRLSFDWIYLGLALAVTVLFRQVFLLFIPVLFGWLLWLGVRYHRRTVWRTVAGLAVAGTILVASIVPWTIRNYRAFDTFVLLNTNAGFAFFWGNHPIHGYNFISILDDDQPAYLDLIPAELRPLNEAELDRALLKQGLGFIQADPARYLILSASRLKDYFKFWPSADSGLFSNLARVISFGILWPLMAIGFFISLRKSWQTSAFLLHLFVLVYTGVHLLTWALIRYRLPVDAVLVVFASAALFELYPRIIPRYFRLRRLWSADPSR